MPQRSSHLLAPTIIPDFWTKKSTGLTATERGSLATLSAKLCASGICAGDLARCALWLFKEALETERCPTDSSSKSTSRHLPVPLSDLLPACLEWLTYGNFKLAKLSIDNYNPTPFQATNGDQVSASPGHVALEIRNEGPSLQVITALIISRFRANEPTP